MKNNLMAKIWNNVWRALNWFKIHLDSPSPNQWVSRSDQSNNSIRTKERVGPSKKSINK